MNKARIEGLARELFAMECTMSEIVGALQIVVRETREEGARVCESERVDETGHPDDRAYNLATEHCAAAIRRLGEE